MNKRNIESTLKAFYTEMNNAQTCVVVVCIDDDGVECVNVGVDMIDKVYFPALVGACFFCAVLQELWGMISFWSMCSAHANLYTFCICAWKCMHYVKFTRNPVVISSSVVYRQWWDLISAFLPHQGGDISNKQKKNQQKSTRKMSQRHICHKWHLKAW